MSDAYVRMAEHLSVLERETNTAPQLAGYFSTGQWEFIRHDTQPERTIITIRSTHGTGNFSYKPFDYVKPWTRKDGTVWGPYPESLVVVDYSVPMINITMDHTTMLKAGYIPTMNNGTLRKYDKPLIRYLDLEDPKKRPRRNARASVHMDPYDDPRGDTTVIPGHRVVAGDEGSKEGRTILLGGYKRVPTPDGIHGLNHHIQTYQDKFMDTVFEAFVEDLLG